MAIKLDCPRCKTRLHVPSKLADGYVHCPQCKGRVWVARESAARPGPAAAAPPPPEQSPPAPAAPASSVGLVERPATAVAGGAPPDTPATAVAGRFADAAPPPAPARRKKVARFITAEAAQSTLQPAADGKLPDLRLEEGAAQQKPQSGQRSMNPLVLLGVLSASVAGFRRAGVDRRASGRTPRRPNGRTHAAGDRKRVLRRRKHREQEPGTLSGAARARPSGPTAAATSRPSASTTAACWTCSVPNAAPTRRG